MDFLNLVPTKNFMLLDKKKYVFYISVKITTERVVKSEAYLDRTSTKEKLHHSSASMWVVFCKEAVT